MLARARREKASAPPEPNYAELTRLAGKRRVRQVNTAAVPEAGLKREGARKVCTVIAA